MTKTYFILLFYYKNIYVFVEIECVYVIRS